MASPATSHRQLLQPDPGLGGVDAIHNPLTPSTSSSSSSTSSSSPSSSAASTVTDDGLVSVDMADGDDFSVCTMKTVSVSSLLMPSPCYLVLLLLCPPIIGFVLFLFVQHFVPVFVQILMDM